MGYKKIHPHQVQLIHKNKKGHWLEQGFSQAFIGKKRSLRSDFMGASLNLWSIVCVGGG
jgi:hypothetical protein